MNELKKELEEIKLVAVEKTRKNKLMAYQKELASLKFRKIKWQISLIKKIEKQMG